MFFLYYYFWGVKIEGGNGVRYDHWRGGEKKGGKGYNPPEGMQESSVDGIDEFRRQLLFGPRRPNRLVS